MRIRLARKIQRRPWRYSHGQVSASLRRLGLWFKIRMMIGQWLRG